MRRRPRGRSAGNEWIGLAEATRMLGISASTLRRWADEGRIRTFVTPGGHRRFSRAAIEALLPGGRRVPAEPDVLAGETPDRMRRVYRRALAQGAAADVAWFETIATDDRDRFRDHGRHIIEAILVALETVDPAEREAGLRRGEEHAAAYGRAAAAVGLPGSAAAGIFLRFRRPFVAELSAMTRRRDLDATTTTGVLDAARDAFDRLLIAMLRAHEESVADLAVAAEADDALGADEAVGPRTTHPHGSSEAATR